MQTEKEMDVVVSEAEWEVMRVVWANREVTSRDVINVLHRKMDWKESTIKTLMGRLVDKGALNTKREGRVFVYSANISEENTVKHYSSAMLGRVCDQKNGLVLQHLVKDATLSQSDIETLIAQLKEKMKNAPEIVPCNCVPGQCDCHLIADVDEMDW